MSKVKIMMQVAWKVAFHNQIMKFTNERYYLDCRERYRDG
jgi:hypothetical protein